MGKPTEAARAARTLVLSGSHERRVAALERRLPASAWHRAGEPRIPLGAIRNRLTVARCLADAHRYLPAVRAYAEATQLVEAHLPALLAQRDRARAEAAEAAAAATALRARRASPIGNRKKRRLADERARDYVDRARKILEKNPPMSLNSVAVRLMKEDRDEDEPEARRKTQILGYLRRAGLK